jgi:hypothetical protein
MLSRRRAAGGRRAEAEGGNRRGVTRIRPFSSEGSTVTTSRDREHEGSRWRRWLIAHSIGGSFILSGRGANGPLCAAACADMSPAADKKKPTPTSYDRKRRRHPNSKAQMSPRAMLRAAAQRDPAGQLERSDEAADRPAQAASCVFLGPRRRWATSGSFDGRGPSDRQRPGTRPRRVEEIVRNKQTSSGGRLIAVLSWICMVV